MYVRCRIKFAFWPCVMCVCVLSLAYQKMLSFSPLLELGSVEPQITAEGEGEGEREGGGGGERSNRTVKVGEKFSLNVNLKSLAPKVCLCEDAQCSLCPHWPLL